jgi:4'-phosphopantetheinyl transferase EntD
LQVELCFVREHLDAVCVGVKAPDDVDIAADARLHPEEQSFALALSAARRASFALGRIALREAATRLGVALPPVLSSEGGEPLLPKGVAGSISHKRRLAVAMAALTDDAQIGVDVELLRARQSDLSHKVLSPAERARLSHLGRAELQREVLVRFSLKEATYKALYPWVRRYVGFHEVEVDPAPDGSAAFHFALKAGEGPFACRGRWEMLDGFGGTPATLSMVGLQRAR